MHPDEAATSAIDEVTGPDTHYSGLPSRLRLLCISPTEPSWVSLTLQLDAEGCHQPQFRWVSTFSEALAVLRDESFDCVLVSDRTYSVGSIPLTNSSFEILSLVRAIRASGCDDPIVLITTQLDEENWAKLCEYDSEILIAPNLWESMSVVPVIKRAISRVELLRENHRLAIADHRRLIRDRDEAERLLKQQRQIISELETITQNTLDANDFHETTVSSKDVSNSPQQRAPFLLPPEINEYYQELLRTYVIMGSGSLGNEIAFLAELISTAGLTPRETLELHLERLEILVRGLGSRSTRHVMARADLLALELMMHLGECYHQRLADQMS